VPSRNQSPRFLKLMRPKTTTALQSTASSTLALTDVSIAIGNTHGPVNAMTAIANETTSSAQKFFIVGHNDTYTVIHQSTTFGITGTAAMIVETSPLH
jgi:hypothetical protein